MFINSGWGCTEYGGGLNDHDPKAHAPSLWTYLDGQKMTPEEIARLKPFGYAPGGYLHPNCGRCGNEFTGDKRAAICHACAVELADFTEANPGVTTEECAPLAAALAAVAKLDLNPLATTPEQQIRFWRKDVEGILRELWEAKK
jgi:hypothetical protein